MSGKGKFTDYFGSSYDGQWEDNKRKGYGISIELHGDKEPCDSNNGTYQGWWYDNQKSGEGKFTYANGTIYNGQWDSGMKDG